MKKLSERLRYIITLALSTLIMNVNGQFVSAGAGENSISGVTAIPRGQVGNDILYFNGDTYAVSVWGDYSSSAGLAWEVDYNSSPYISCTTLVQTNFVFYPDVCLVEDGTDVYAIVVYWVGGTVNTYYWESYIWANIGGWGFQPNSNSSFQSASFGTSLHIDGSDNGEFIIVWDDGNPEINVITGDLSSGPAITGGQNGISDAGNGGYSPDVCIYHNGGTDVVHVTYIESAFNNLMVDDHNFADLDAGTSTGNNQLIQGAVLSFYFPRIACPTSNGGGVTDWLVVAEDNNALNSYYIVGFSFSNSYVYNDCSAAGGFTDDLTSYPNYRPVVTFDDQSTYAWVGWMFDNSGGFITGNAVDAFYPIALQCDLQGAIFDFNYWNVPTSLNSADQFDFLALSCRFSNDQLYLTYNNASTSDIFTKFATFSTATSFRKGNINSVINPTTEKIFNQLLKEKVDLICNLKLIDLSGREVLIETGTIAKIKEILRKARAEIQDGIYLMQILSDDGTISFNSKIAVQ